MDRTRILDIFDTFDILRFRILSIVSWLSQLSASARTPKMSKPSPIQKVMAKAPTRILDVIIYPRMTVRVPPSNPIHQAEAPSF